jgi:ABC-2 type transport system permease protein
MRSTLALVRASWLSVRSYRLRLLLSVISLLVSVVPLYFVANALQPVMADKIAGQGGEFFGFLIIGMVAFMLLPPAVNALPGAIGSGINTGIFEALLGTRARLPALVAGLTGFDLLWTALRALLMLVGAWLFGAAIVWTKLGGALLILLLIVLAYVPFALMASAMVIVFRTPGPLAKGVLALSGLLGGVYYPTEVIPSWIERVSDFIPLAYGLRALRATLLEGVPLSGVLPQLGMLCIFIVVLMSIGWFSLYRALHHARRAGTLSHY